MTNLGIADTATQLDTAHFSKCGRFRYLLTREFGGDSTCLFIMLNPSSADAERNDPTIRRCIGFAQREGFGRLEIVNLYAFRTASPSELFTSEDPVGPENDHEILESLNRADLVIAAWGNQAVIHPARLSSVQQMIERSSKLTKCFGLTKPGLPRHPLYLGSDAELIPIF